MSSISSSKRLQLSSDLNSNVGGAPPAKKRAKNDFDFDSKFIASSQDDLDIGLLRVQNRRLSERLSHRQRIEAELRSRIEQMEKKQLNDDTKLYVINRYWNQLNEDMRLILQRFDSTATNNETNNQPSSVGNEDEDSTDGDGTTIMVGSLNENAETTSFVRQLANVDKEELDEQLQQRVLLSTRAVSKVLQAFDRIVQRNEKVMSALKDRSLVDDDSSDQVANDEDDSDTIKSPDREDDDDDDEDNDDDEVLNDSRSKRKQKKQHKVNLDETVRQLNEELTKENKNLNLLVTTLHEKNHTMSLRYTQLTDKIESKDLQLDELKNRIDELEFELNKSRTREQRLEDHLYEAREKLRDFQNQSNGISGSIGGDGGSSSSNKQDSTSSSGPISSQKIEDLKRELEEQREIATSRLAELEQLNNEHKETLKLVEKYKVDLTCLPDTVIKESAEYKSLQSHFSVLFNESMALKTQLDECRQQLTAAKNVHMRQIEQMEAEELTMQKRLRDECLKLEQSLAQVRKEYEMLRLEFDQTLAVNEQTGPINREMRHLISSLQGHTNQLKGENARIKKKLKEANVEIGRLKHIIEQNGLKVCCGGILLPGQRGPTENSGTGNNSGSTTCTVDCCNNQNTGPQQQQQQQNKSTMEGTTLNIKTEFQPTSDSSNEGSNSLMTSIKNEESYSSSSNKDEKITVKLENTSPQSSSMTSAGAAVTVKKESPSSSSLAGDVIESSSSMDCMDENSQSHLPHYNVRSQQQQQQQQSTSSSSSSVTPHRGKSDDVRELKFQLKKSWEAQRELKLLLDMFKSVDKEKREKVQLMFQEKKLRMELDELRQQNKKVLDDKRGGSSGNGAGSSSESIVTGRIRYSSGSGKTISDDDIKKINKYEDIIKELQKNVTTHKQQEEALLNEMEVTGQAFEDMQEQNCRLIQQLREKDDANFKLMSERIKSNQIQKLLKEEKDKLSEQIVALQQQNETQNVVVRKLEEKERSLQKSLGAIEKELTIRQQAMDFLKRRAVESSQSAADLKLHLDKYVAQVKDAQSIVADKTSAWQQEMFKTKRLHEEVMMYKRKYERAKKFELAATADEVLQEEIRELREELTCPSCKTKRKDAVLNKCFHVFCYDCLKTRYETRQRKCPKCNQSFSANDFHRLYLA